MFDQMMILFPFQLFFLFFFALNATRILLRKASLPTSFALFPSFCSFFSSFCLPHAVACVLSPMPALPVSHSSDTRLNCVCLPFNFMRSCQINPQGTTSRKMSFFFFRFLFVSDHVYLLNSSFRFRYSLRVHVSNPVPLAGQSVSKIPAVRSLPQSLLSYQSCGRHARPDPPLFLMGILAAC